MLLKKLTASFTALAAVAVLHGCNSGENSTNPVIDGVDGPNVSVVNGYVITSMVFKNLSIDGGATIPIPHFPGSSLSIGPDFQSSGTLLTLSISAAEFWDNQNLHLDPHSLPGGRPLPTVGAGALPAIALVVPQLNNAVLYLGLDVLGFFVPFKLDMGGAIVSMNFFNSSKAKVGTISLVGADANGENSGILLLLSTKLLGIGGNSAEWQAMQQLQ